MKKIVRHCLMPLCLLPGAAIAQSSVTIGGIMDAGLRIDSGSTGGSVRSVSSGQMYGSRLNFIGAEDLGSGYKAGFVLETGIALDTGAGTANSPGVTSGMSWGRTAALSIGSDATGYVSVGRQYTPIWALSASGSNDPFVGSWLGGNGLVYSNTVLASNAIVYTWGYGVRTMLGAAPRQGFGMAVLVAPGEAVEPAPKRSGNQFGFNVSYGAGPFFIGAAHHQVRGNGPAINPSLATIDTPKLQQQTISTAYDFGFMRLHAGVNRGKNDATGAGALHRRSWSIGATVPLAPQQSLRVMYGQAKNKVATDADWSAVQIGYLYDLSKRTGLYAAYGFIDNAPNASTAFPRSIGTFAAGSTPKAAIVGIKHTF